MNSPRPPGHLRELSPEKIDRNPQNPRLFFRPEEMDTLLASIRRFGVQVPITVYEDSGRYVLIDGERRWRCATKLNLQRIPALVQEKPTALDNLLLMFNIHSLREQWDYLTIAKKLPDVIALHRDDYGNEPNEIELSELTGLTRGQIRRCRFLLDLPNRYREILEKELELPKHAQQLSEDFFIEMEKALKTVRNRVPEAIADLDAARDTLIQKFRSGTIGNITDFRMLSKMATAVDNIGIRQTRAAQAISDVLDGKKNVGIAEVYAEKFETRYDERKIQINVDSIYEYLSWSLEQDTADVGPALVNRLKRLREMIERILVAQDGV
jgi:ParB/RepB/Spo0J family partition protein